MWKNKLIALLLSSITLPALAQNAQSIQQEALLITGKITDAQTGTPLSNVYIKQHETLNAVFSDEEGHFSIRLLPGASPELKFDKEGFESISTPFKKSVQTEIKLHPVVQYSPPTPPAHSPTKEWNAPIFNNQFTAFYQGSYKLLFSPNMSVGGIMLNEFGLESDILLFKPVVFRGSFFRSRFPVDIENFPFQPAFYVNSQQFKTSAGTLRTLSEDKELFLGAEAVLTSFSPDNRNNQDQNPVPFTGSILDFEQNRLSLGLNATLGWKLNEKLTFFPEASLYPLGVNFIHRDQNKIAYTPSADLGAKLRYEIIPGAYFSMRYRTQMWYGFGDNYFDNQHSLHLGVSLDPWAMSERLAS